MSPASVSIAPTSANAHTKLPTRSVSITFYVSGQQRVLRFDTTDPMFRQTILELREVDRPFRIVYDS